MRLSEFLKKYSGTLSKEDIEELKGMRKNIQIELDEDQEDSDRDILNEEETKAFVKAVENIRQHGVDCKFEEGFTPEQAVTASQKVSGWVSEIENARINGRELTPFEKYMYAYEIATRFVYNMGSRGDDPKLSRNINHVLTGDKIVCVGFASVLRHILNGLGIPCSRVHFSPTEEKQKEAEANGTQARGHAGCLVYIDDPKYKIKGSFISDPTTDSLNPTAKQGQGVKYSVIALAEVNDIYKKLGVELKPDDLEDAKRRCYLSVYLEEDKIHRRETNKKVQLKFLEGFNQRVRNSEVADEYIERYAAEIFEELDIDEQEKEVKDESDTLILSDKLDSIVDAYISSCYGETEKNPFESKKSDIKMLLKHYSPAHLMKIIQERVRGYASQSDAEILKDRFGVDLRDYKGLSDEEEFERYMRQADMATEEVQPLEHDENNVSDTLWLALFRVGKALGLEKQEAEAYAVARIKSWNDEKQQKYLEHIKAKDAEKEADEISEKV